MLKWVAILGGVSLCIGGALLYGAVTGKLVDDEAPGEVAAVSRPAKVVSERSSTQASTIDVLGANAAKQILFGDFHVHTTFSFDSFLMNLPIAGGTGSRPPADACDFARFCSALDFWSINDHAENITAPLWQSTVESVRQCNDVAGDPSNPDLVTYLGWEWSHIGATPETHYGHKNVVLLGTDDDEIPTRPISSRSPAIDRARTRPPLAMRLGIVALNGSRGIGFNRLLNSMADTPRCAEGVAVRDLPTDCLEGTGTPEGLFAKLDDWGFPSIVIPHGTAWGIYTPAGSDWRKQLAGHDPNRQNLVEIYSGHGNSEQLPNWREVDIADDGSRSCSRPRDGYLPSCWRAGELIGSQCLAEGLSESVCAQRAVDARQHYVDANQAGWKTAPGFEANDWLAAGQAPDGFQPAFNYRPRSSVQYMLAIRDFADPANPTRFDFGFLGSSDTHTASGGQGYKEFARGEMSDGRGRRPNQRRLGGGGVFGSSSGADQPVSQSVPFVSAGESPLQLFEIERASAYFVTGGLVAVHSSGRDRYSIWDALQNKEVYATSGRRTLMWFDLIDGDQSIPMGSTTQRSALPRFRVRAAGSFEQKPGCPDHVIDGLGPDRVEAICLGECYNPGESRRPITRIEVVRIRPQIREDEPLEGLVEDPWRVFPCPADSGGCVVEFADTEFAETKRDTVYYARAIEASDLLIHGSNPLGCRYDDDGDCVEVSPCNSRTSVDDDCLSEAEPRAWSSPIYVDYREDSKTLASTAQP